MDSLLEGDGFELSVPRVMEVDLARQVPALIAVFELAGTAVTSQRGTKCQRRTVYTTERDGSLSRAPFTGYIGASCLGRRLIEVVGRAPSPYWRDGDV